MNRSVFIYEKYIKNKIIVAICFKQVYFVLCCLKNRVVFKLYTREA